MEEEKKEEIKENIPKKFDITEKIRNNPWILSTFVLGILVMILLITTLFGGVTGNVISENKMGELALDFFNNELSSTTGTLDSVEETSGLYEVNLNIQDKVVPLYFTKDGKFIQQGYELVSITETTSSDSTQTQEVPKSDKPTVELYVFTYCPYGLQMEKAIIPVVNLLKDKIDFKIRQIGAMHGEYEKIEAERQLCIEKEYPAKFLDYILAFAEDTSIGNCKGDATCLATPLNVLYTKLGIDASKINSCMASDGVTMYNNEVSNSQSNGVSGSPTLIINGVGTQSSRSPEAIKGVICNAFNNVPSECSQTLSTEQASAGFGSGTSSSSTSASC